MKSVGLIAEYNPFHNGHKYHLNQAFSKTKSDAAIVIMSGNFVQRGFPAATDKYTRTKMALAEGAHLVFELPTAFALSSAEDFARGAILMLEELGLTDSLCFGSESGNLDELMPFAALLAKEPENFQMLLREKCKQGLSYPAAREQAAIETLSYSGTSPLSSPNNLLGIEYIKSILRLNSSIRPVTIQRSGVGYHETKTDGVLASATGIREMNSLAERKKVMPEAASRVYEEALSAYEPICANDFSDLIYHSLLMQKENLAQIKDITSDLANRIRSLLTEYYDFDSFVTLLTTKQITRTRIQRCLFQTLLGITKSLPQDNIPLRLLGMRKEAIPLLGKIKRADLLVTKPSQAKKVLPEDAYTLLEKDFMAADLYSYIHHHRAKTEVPDYLSSEYKHSPIIL